MRVRMRSKPRKPAWPSLVWNTRASMPRCRSARTPPMPRRISLAQPVLGVAAVEAVGDHAEVVGVLVDIGVEEQQRGAAYLGTPDLRDELLAGEIHFDLSGPSPAVLAAIVHRAQRHRHAVGVEVREALLLPAVDRQRLAEVAVSVEQTHADERDGEVGGGLQVIARQNSQAAGVWATASAMPYSGEK